MRLLIVDYLASLKEREELDAILPDLLTELGYNVISRPRRGTQQRGVDIAAVRKVDGAEVLYLFSLKAGICREPSGTGRRTRPCARRWTKSATAICRTAFHLSTATPRWSSASVSAARFARTSATWSPVT